MAKPITETIERPFSFFVESKNLVILYRGQVDPTKLYSYLSKEVAVTIVEGFNDAFQLGFAEGAKRFNEKK